VYRRFDDEEDEEEEIDEEDMGLLQRSPESSAKSLRTLTRRSIKPKRLFQTEAQKKAREVQEEEEALTDIEESTGPNADAPMPSSDSLTAKTGRSLRSTAKVLPDEFESNSPAGTSVKKTSPFDAWPRLKSGGSSTAAAYKGRKRGAPEASGDTDDSVAATTMEPKKVKI
jgi:hypothetical protein